MSLSSISNLILSIIPTAITEGLGLVPSQLPININTNTNNSTNITNTAIDPNYIYPNGWTPTSYKKLVLIDPNSLLIPELTTEYRYSSNRKYTLIVVIIGIVLLLINTYLQEQNQRQSTAL